MIKTFGSCTPQNRRRHRHYVKSN